MSTQPELNVDVNIYKGPFPRFPKPKIIGYIGLENLKFARKIHEGSVRYDLDHLSEKAIHKPDNLDVKLTELLKFLLSNEARLKFPIASRLEDATIHCYRGLMTCVAITPYTDRDPWKIVAILFKGNIYLCARETEEKKKKKQNMTARDRQLCAWGFKFEQYMLSDKPDVEPNPNEPVNETEEFSLVFTTNINTHTVVYGAEMDGIRCDKGQVSEPPNEEQGPEAVIDYLSSKEFIELKTHRHLKHVPIRTNFRKHIAKKWWCQSHLAGIDTIVAGLHNNGKVQELKLFPLNELLQMSKKYWSPEVCYNFLHDFFTYVKSCFSKKIREKHGEEALNQIHTLPMMTLLFEWSPKSSVVVNENYSHEDDPILPDWFINQYGKPNPEDSL